MDDPLGLYLARRIDWKGGDDACWPWLLSKKNTGYGQAWDGATVVLAHRLVWTYLFGSPGEMTIDHLCRNRPCCNPDHLRLLTNVENARLNGASQRTHCPAGHPYDQENTYVCPKGHRRCRQCARDRRVAA